LVAQHSTQSTDRPQRSPNQCPDPRRLILAGGGQQLPILPGHRPILRLTGEQDPDHCAGRLAVLPVAGQAGADSFGHCGRLALPVGRDAGVLTAILLVLAAVLVATVGQAQQEQVPGKRRGDRGTP